MSLHKTISYASFAVVLGTVSASADITGPEVWENWKTSFGSFGYDITATEDQSGDTFTVSDIALRNTLPDDMGQVEMQMETITFTSQSDGSVSVVFPATTRVNASADIDGEKVTFAIDMAMSDPSMRISGDSENMKTEMSSAEMSVTLADYSVDIDEELPEDLFVFAMTMRDLDFTSDYRRDGDKAFFDYTYGASQLSYQVALNAPTGEDEGFDLNGEVNAISVTSEGQMPTAPVDVLNWAELLKGGMSVTSTFSYTGGGSMSAEIVERYSPPATVQTSSSAGSLKVAMGPNGVEYDVRAKDQTLNMVGGEVPIPVELAVAEAGFHLLFPIIADAEREQDFALGILYKDFTISDMIWGLFDPAGQLPRDPATIKLDLSGKVKVLVDYLDPNFDESDFMGQPMEISALTFKEVLISALGVNASANGAMTFDNENKRPFQPIPDPIGQIDVRVEGINGLMDTAISMGLVPEDQAMMPRMMMGMFTVPEGDDILTSTIEMKEGGEIYANGQRLQ